MKFYNERIIKKFGRAIMTEAICAYFSAAEKKYRNKSKKK